MPGTVRTSVLMIIFYSLHASNAFSQPTGAIEAEVIRFNIVRIDTKTTVGNTRTSSSSYYDTHGKNVKFISDDSVYRYIAYYEFTDTLLKKLVEVKYENGKLIDSLVHEFFYKFDSKGRIIENKLVLPSGEARINTIIYNQHGKFDTTYSHSTFNDSDLKLNQCTRYLYRGDTTFIYFYDSPGWKNPNFRVVERITSDSLYHDLTKEYKIEGGELKELKRYTTRLYFADGRQLKFESENSVVQHSYEKDERGLVRKHTMHSKSGNREQIQVDTFEYYFRK